MTRIVLLTDEHVMEGILGMISLGIAVYLLSITISAPRPVILGMAFFISWYFRRAGIHIYQYVKKHHKLSISPITYNIK